MSGRQRGSSGLGAPGSTGAAGARDPLGAPGSTGASMTTAGAPGYDPTEYGMGQQQQLHRPEEYSAGGERQQHRPAADIMGTNVQQGYTAGSMGHTATGAGYHVPHSAGMTASTFGTGGDLDTGDYRRAGVGEGFHREMGERDHGVGRERGGHLGVATDTVIIESVGGGVDSVDLDHWAQGIGKETHGSNDAGGGTKQRTTQSGQRRA